MPAPSPPLLLTPPRAGPGPASPAPEMEKLLEVAEQEVLVDFQLGVKCRAAVNLKSLHPTAAVAFKVQTSSPHKFLVNPPSGLLPPLSAAAFQVILKPQSHLPSPFPRPGSSDRFLVKAAVVAHHEEPPGKSPDAFNAWFSARPRLATQDTRLKVVYAGALLLRHAVSDGDADAVRQILRRQKSLVSRLGSGDSASFLRSTSSCRDPAVLNLLVEAGWKPPKQIKAAWPISIKSPTTTGTGVSNSKQIKAAGPISIKSPTTTGSGVSNPKEAAAPQGKPSAGAIDSTAAAAKGWTRLHSAAASGSYDALVGLIGGSEPPELDPRDGEGRTPLQLAISKGHIRCVRALLDRGADGNARSNDGRTALHRAAANGGEEMVALLLDVGADPSVLSARGRSPLDVARDKGHQDVVEILERGEMVLTAARRGEVKRLESLLRKGVGANGRDQYGMTALHSAAVKGHRDVVRLLAEFGAELECQDVEGHTPLHLAVEGGCVDTVEALVDLGADVNAKSRRGATPLYMARSMGYDAVAQLLLSRGAASSSAASSSNASLSPALALHST